MLRVRPGVELVRASFDPINELITLDFPTLERPRNATSGRLGAGNCAGLLAAARNLARTLMLKFAMGGAELASPVPFNGTQGVRSFPRAVTGLLCPSAIPMREAVVGNAAR